MSAGRNLSVIQGIRERQRLINDESPNDLYSLVNHMQISIERICDILQDMNQHEQETKQGNAS